MDENFVIPQIPVIHVPQYQDPRWKPPTQGSASGQQPPIQKVTPSESSHASKYGSTGETNRRDPRKLLPSVPNMCSNCSIALLEYLIPLQEYLTEVINVTVKQCDIHHMNPDDLKSHPNVLQLLKPGVSSLISRRHQRTEDQQLTPESSDSEVERGRSYSSSSQHSGSDDYSDSEKGYETPQESPFEKVDSEKDDVKTEKSQETRSGSPERKHQEEGSSRSRQETSGHKKDERREDEKRPHRHEHKHDHHHHGDRRHSPPGRHEHRRHHSPDRVHHHRYHSPEKRREHHRQQSPKGRDIHHHHEQRHHDRRHHGSRHHESRHHKDEHHERHHHQVHHYERHRDRHRDDHRDERRPEDDRHEEEREARHEEMHRTAEHHEEHHEEQTHRPPPEPRPRDNQEHHRQEEQHEEPLQEQSHHEQHEQEHQGHHHHEEKQHEHEYHSQLSGTQVLPEEFPELSVQAVEETLIEYSDEEPYAYVTLVYNNISAVNAIILANSVILTTQKNIVIFGKNYRIPFVVLLEGNIDPILKKSLHMVFDEVISERQDFRLSLLRDMSVGVQHMKIQLWRSLERFKKCLFIESSCLVLGDLSGVFTEFSELSACVDWIFPDCFDCSVFVFEPKEVTYNDLVTTATQLQQEADDAEEVDESMILNQFFSHKWNKMSFIYNFVQNSEIYTQQPAFMKFGGSIKIVNFGYVPLSSNAFNSPSFNNATQPWHVMFDLTTSILEGAQVATTSPVNRYVKFYISLFLKRLWPLIQMPLTPLLMARVGRREWSIHELIRLLSSLSGTEEVMFSPISFRRKTPAPFTFGESSDDKKLSPEVKEEVSRDVKSPEEIKKEPLGDHAVETPEVVEDESAKSSDAEKVTEGEEIKHEAADEDEGAVGGEKEDDEKLVEDPHAAMRPWETGSIDWMGAHKSDTIIEKLKSRFK